MNFPAIILPDVFLHSIFDVTPKFLNKLGVEALILDVDNTLREWGSKIPVDGVFGWVSSMKDAGIKLIIASNNFKKRVEPFAKKLGLDYVFFSCKPLSFGLNKAAKKLNVDRKKIAVVGDQIFTDVFGGNLRGFKTFLVEPFLKEKGCCFKLKRWLEQQIIKSCK